MVIPFVYADKSSLFHEIFPRTRYQVIWLIQLCQVGASIFFILLLINQAHRLRQQLRYSRLWKRSRKVSFYRNSRSTVDDKAKFRGRITLLPWRLLGRFTMYEFCKTSVYTRLGFHLVYIWVLVEMAHFRGAETCRFSASPMPLPVQDYCSKEDGSHGSLSSRKRACRTHMCERSINKVSGPASCRFESFSVEQTYRAITQNAPRKFVSHLKLPF